MLNWTDHTREQSLDWLPLHRNIGLVMMHFQIIQEKAKIWIFMGTLNFQMWEIKAFKNFKYGN